MKRLSLIVFILLLSVCGGCSHEHTEESPDNRVKMPDIPYGVCCNSLGEDTVNEKCHFCFNREDILEWQNEIPKTTKNN